MYIKNESSYGGGNSGLADALVDPTKSPLTKPGGKTPNKADAGMAAPTGTGFQPDPNGPIYKDAATADRFAKEQERIARMQEQAKTGVEGFTPGWMTKARRHTTMDDMVRSFNWRDSDQALLAKAKDPAIRKQFQAGVKVPDGLTAADVNRLNLISVAGDSATAPSWYRSRQVGGDATPGGALGVLYNAMNKQVDSSPGGPSPKYQQAHPFQSTTPNRLPFDSSPGGPMPEYDQANPFQSTQPNLLRNNFDSSPGGPMPEYEQAHPFQPYPFRNNFDSSPGGPMPNYDQAHQFTTGEAMPVWNRWRFR